MRVVRTWQADDAAEFAEFKAFVLGKNIDPVKDGVIEWDDVALVMRQTFEDRRVRGQ